MIVKWRRENISGKSIIFFFEGVCVRVGKINENILVKVIKNLERTYIFFL